MPTVPPPTDDDSRRRIRDRLRVATETLEWIAADRGVLAMLPEADRIRLRQAVAAVFDPDARARRRVVKTAGRLRRAARADRDDAVLAATGIRALRRQPVFTTPNVRRLAPAESAAAPAAEPPSGADVGVTTLDPRACYICKVRYSAVHHFYDRLCPTCGDVNFAKRTESADLSGTVSLLTGGRVKIGYQAGLKLLRAGTHLIVTTRFPVDAAARFARESDFDDWRDRLEIVGLDLRHTPSVEAFCRQLVATRPRLDVIVNNACQTVRRPPGFYAHMLAAERESDRVLPPAARSLLRDVRRAAEPGPRLTGDVSARSHGLSWDPLVGLTEAARLSQVALMPEDAAAEASPFPVGLLDQDLQQIDLRDRNSWRLLLADVPTVELLEVQLVNAIAPFVINARLKPLMQRTPGRAKHIVNVSAVEGQFYRPFKTTRHPHTNMAKAALNMMTRTSAADYHADGIHMNSVDTGWVTDEDPEVIAARKTVEQRFHPPLDVVDGAARVVDPIVTGVRTGEHVWGKFLKDYAPADW